MNLAYYFELPLFNDL